MSSQFFGPAAVVAAGDADQRIVFRKDVVLVLRHGVEQRIFRPRSAPRNVVRVDAAEDAQRAVGRGVQALFRAQQFRFHTGVRAARYRRRTEGQ